MIFSLLSLTLGSLGSQAAMAVQTEQFSVSNIVVEGQPRNSVSV